MSDHTKIEWADATVNAVNGCSVLSPGCTNCYAMRAGGRNLPGHPSTGLTVATKAGHVWTGEVRLSETALLQPLRWKRPRRIFWNAHGDLFHENVPDEWIDRVFAVCALTPQHTHMILTKRSARMREWMIDRQVDVWDDATRIPRTSKVRLGFGGLPAYSAFTMPMWPLPNVWLGVSVEDQARADERIPDLLATPAAIRWISAEPLLGPVHLRNIDFRPSKLGCGTVDVLDHEVAPAIDWVIAGGESGPGARPMHPDWACGLRDQCAAAGVPFHFKQWGEWAASGPHNRETVIGGPEGASHPIFETRWIDNTPKAGRTLIARVGKKRAGRLLDGVTHDGVPG